MNKGIIYTLSDPITNEIRYIGFTTRTLKERLREHIKDAQIFKNKRHSYNWINKLLKNNTVPVIEELDVCEINNVKKYEIYWIAQFKAWGFRLVNASEGGEGLNGYKRTEKQKAIDSFRQQKPIYKYDLTDNLIEYYHYSITASIVENVKSHNITRYAKYHFIKITNDFYFSYLNPNQILELKEQNKLFKKLELLPSEKMTLEAKKRIGLANSKIKRTEAEKERLRNLFLGKKHSQATKNKMKISQKGNYVHFSKEFLSNIGKTKAIEVFTLNNEYLYSFSSIIEASKELKISVGNISNIIKTTTISKKLNLIIKQKTK